jgi:hypothetical protein
VKGTRGCFVAYVLVSMLIFSAAIGIAPAPSGATNEGTAHTNAAGGTTSSHLHTKLLAISDMPAGWSTTTSSQGSEGSGTEGCIAPSMKHDTYATIGFLSASKGFESVVETLQSGPDVADIYSEMFKRLHDCHGPLHGVVVKAMSFPTMGIRASAYTVSASLSFSSEKLNSDIVVFTQGPYVGSLALGATSQVDAALLQTLFTKAIAQLSATTAKPVSSGAVVVTCTRVTRHEASCLAPGWESAYSITFGGSVPKHLGACLTKKLPQGFRYLLLTPNSEGELSNAQASSEGTIQNALEQCS